MIVVDIAVIVGDVAVNVAASAVRIDMTVHGHKELVVVVDRIVVDRIVVVVCVDFANLVVVYRVAVDRVAAAAAGCIVAGVAVFVDRVVVVADCVGFLAAFFVGHIVVDYTALVHIVVGVGCNVVDQAFDHTDVDVVRAAVDVVRIAVGVVRIAVGVVHRSKRCRDWFVDC